VTEVTNLIASYINAIKFRQSIGYPEEATTQTPPTPGEQTAPVFALSMKHGTSCQSPDELTRSKSQPFPATQRNGQPRVILDQHGELCGTSSA
jgi:hypothetical protein